jgi:hypothetical protein
LRERPKRAALVPQPQGPRFSANRFRGAVAVGRQSARAFIARGVLRLPGKSKSDSILNGERGFG